MKLIRYQVKPEHVAENARLITDVFKELEASAPNDMRYLVLELPDGTFVHIAEGNLTALNTHKAFRADIDARASEKPRTAEATVIGNYRMLGTEGQFTPK